MSYSMVGMVLCGIVWCAGAVWYFYTLMVEYDDEV